MLRYKYWLLFLLFTLTATIMCACGKKKEAEYNDGRYAYSHPSSAVPVETAKTGTGLQIQYDSQMTAVIKTVDTDAGIVILKEVETGINYTLTYTGATQVLDKYNMAMTMAQVNPGDVVQAYYYSKKVQLTGIQYKSDIWEYNSSNWKVDTNNQRIKIGNKQFYYKDDLVIMSDGQEVSLMDLSEQDVLTIRGRDGVVLSVTVEKGHGYIRLTGIEEFIDGWIEIGKIIKPVKENMLIVAPEGNYDVKIVKDGFGGMLGAAVARNKETVVDFTDLGAKVVKYGTVEFTIKPEDATLYIAGKETDFSSQILLEYDTYRVIVKADGYEDVTMDLKVNQTLIQKKVELNASTEGQTSPKPTATVSSDGIVTPDPTTTTTPNITSSLYKIHVSEPEGAAVYFDDSYVGVAPVSFSKTSGTHTLTLSKSGYITKSYTIEVGTEDTDVTFTLPDLAAE